MLGFLYRILIGNFKSCNHEFETIDQIKRNSYSGDPNKFSGLSYVLRCKKCGDIKTKEIF